jgi:hypothetical protein
VAIYLLSTKCLIYLLFYIICNNLHFLSSYLGYLPTYISNHLDGRKQRVDKIHYQCNSIVVDPQLSYKMLKTWQSLIKQNHPTREEKKVQDGKGLPSPSKWRILPPKRADQKNKSPKFWIVTGNFIKIIIWGGRVGIK